MLNHTHPQNRQLIAYYQAQRPDALPFAAADSVPNTAAYFNLGSHPDIVERVWEGLGSGLSPDCRAIVYGSPGLVQPQTGVVMVMAYGTQYALRIPDEFLVAALERGCKREQVWAGGHKTDIEAQFGDGWLFGCWAKEETQWLRATYERLKN